MLLSPCDSGISCMEPGLTSIDSDAGDLGTQPESPSVTPLLLGEGQFCRNLLTGASSSDEVTLQRSTTSMLLTSCREITWVEQRSA